MATPMKKPATKKETTFVWTGANKRGEQAAGELVAVNLIMAKAALRNQGIIIKKINPKRSPMFSPSAKKITTADITIFSRQMATMMTSGIPLVQSFEIVARGHSNPSAQELILKIKSSVEGGSTFAESLAKHPVYFNDLFCNLVAAGEQSGCLEDMLCRVATYKEKTESMKAKIKKAMMYPTAVLVVAFGVTVCLMLFVVPQFESFFKNFGGALPAPTQFVVDMSKFFQSYWWVMIGVIVGVIAVFKKAHETSEKFAYFMDRVILKLPIIGIIIEKGIIARFTRTLAITFAAGMPLIDALTSVSGATGNRLFAQATLRIRDDVSTGQQLQTALKATGLFPNMVQQMVAIGEESGALEKMLSKVADFYEEEVDIAVDGLSSLLEPVIIVFLAVVVGGLVVAMYMPIFKLGSVL